MRILSIETSCDETAVSIIEAWGGIESPVYKILGNALYSQIDVHSEYGGVFPMLAKREHAKNLVPLFKKATELSGITTNPPELTEEKKIIIKEVLSKEEGMFDLLVEYINTHEVPDIDCIAVTEGPGLEPALWVGISFAKALSIILDKPLVPINHMEGHIVSVLMSDGIEYTNGISPQVSFPALALLISGGHTELVLSEDWHKYKIIGQTVDDAVGEAFDKVARLLNLPYPGGPKISKLAKESRESNFKNTHKELDWQLPRPMLKSGDYNFSFSGLKTAVLYAVQNRLKEKSELSDIEQKMLAEEFENAVTEVLIEKTKKALTETQAESLIVGGGVIANTYIRNALQDLITHTFPHTKLLIPTIDLTTDNSVMIGIAGYLRYMSEDPKILTPDEVLSLTAKGNLSL